MIKLRLLLCVLPLLTISAVLGGSYGTVDSDDGGSDLPDDQVEEVLALYRKHCSSSIPSSSGGYGGYGPAPSSPTGGYGGYGPAPTQAKVSIVCKEGNDHYGPPKKQIIRIPTQKPKKNIVFVEAPTLKLKHQINLISNGAQSPRTVIYVLPNKNSHQIKLWDKRGQQQAGKPQVFFLKNDRLLSPSSPPQYGVPQPQPQPGYGVQQPLPSYGVPQPQPIVVTTPRPIYGLPITTYRPSTSYDTVLPSQPAITSDYGLNALLPPKQFLLQSGSGLVPFDPSSLGPEYEIVPADQGTRNAYQNLFAVNGLPSGSESQIQPQFQLQTETSYEGVGGESETPEIRVQPLSSRSLFTSVDSNGAYAGGKLQFPSESIQNYQIQAFDGAKKQEPSVGVKTPESSNADELTDAEAEKRIKSLIAAYEKRQEEATLTTSTSTTSTTPTPTSTTTTTTTTTPSPPITTSSTENPQPRRLNTNLFDENFVRNLISNAKLTRDSSNLNNESILRAIPSPNSFNSYHNSNVVFRYFRNSDQLSSLTPPPQPSQLSSATPYNRITSSNKRSVASPGFEIFPANFVSYSYSKVDADKNENTNN